MAAAELKSNDSNNSLHEVVIKNNISTMVVKKNVEYYKFTTFDIIIYVLCIGVFLLNTLTDIIVAIDYFLHDYTVWMYLTINFKILPLVILQIVSLRWYQRSDSIKVMHWVMHITCLGILQRYFVVLKAAIQGVKSTVPLKRKDQVLQIQNDVFTLSLLSSFLVDASQTIVQLYILAIARNIMLWASISAVLSLSSIIWTIAVHTKFILTISPPKQYPILSALTIEVLWRTGFLVSRITALVLGALCTKNWFFVLLGLHWLGMTVWLMMQKTHSCSTTWEDWACNCLIGMVNCFDFLKLQSDGRSWYRILTFYSVMIVENLVFLCTYILFFKDTFKLDVLILNSTAIVGGTTIGLANMSLYYCMFRHTDSTILCVLVDSKISMEKPGQSISSGALKSTKSSLSSLQRSGDLSQGVVLADEVTADKKSLLTNIVHNNESIEKGIVNRSFTNGDEMDITNQHDDNEIVAESNKENLDSVKDESSCNDAIEVLQRQKRRGICSSVEANLEKSDMEFDELDINLCSRKRRGICSLTQLCQEEKKFSLETRKPCVLMQEEAILKDNIEEKKKNHIEIDNESLNKGKNLEGSQKDDTRSHVSSIHDYENLCPLGIARPPWCIRSWKGYTDIETYIHDDSVVRDRRRDTLTSTATGTTLSSEYSEATYASLPFRRLLKRSRQDDYLDTLAYDLVDFESSLFPNEGFTVSEIEEQVEPTLFAAKPVVIDDKGGMLALDTILEEHEDHTSPKKPTNSLVATIDEIRKCTADNSPRHIYYHRSESQWEDLERRISMSRARLATVLFENQYNDISKYNSPWRYTTSPFARHHTELDAIKEIYSRERATKIPLIDAVLSDSPILGSRTENSAIKCVREHVDLFPLEEDNVYVDMNGAGIKKSDDIYEEVLTTLQNKDILTLPSSNMDEQRVETDNEEQTQILKTVSSLINTFNSDSPAKTPQRLMPLNKNPPVQKKANVNVVSKKDEPPYSNFHFSNHGRTLYTEKRQRPINRPRRKFSLLRERFEPKSDYTVRANKSFTNHWAKTNTNRKGISIILREQETFDSVIAQEKENLTTKINFSSTFSNSSQNSCQFENKSRSDLKEKRSVFLKQILSSPKFQGWSETRTFSPNAKIVPKAV